MGMKAGGSEQAGREHQHWDCVAWVWPPEALGPLWAGVTLWMCSFFLTVKGSSLLKQKA